MTRALGLAAASLAVTISVVSAQAPTPAPAPAPAPASPAAAAPDVAAGEQVFKRCLPCHSIGPGATNKVGPEQNGLDGRKAGTVEGYNYSDANKNSGITWNEQTFKEYIIDPKAKIPGTKMVFPGLKSENDRNNLWAYLKQFNADGTKKP
jgi:cytochrome c